MFEIYYSNLQFLVWVFMLVSGGYLLIGKVPCREVFNSYRKSRTIIGVAFLVFSAHFFLQWKFDARDSLPLVASALNITFFYLSSILFSWAFISLLDDKYLSRTRVFINLTIWILVSIAVWVSVLFLPERIAMCALVGSAIWLFFYLTRISWTFYRAYHRAVKRIRDYYSDQVDGFIRWMSKSVFYAIVMGLLCPIMAFAPKWSIAFYLAASVPLFFYIFVSFMDYLINYETVDNAIADSIMEKEVSTDSRNSYSDSLDEQVGAWIAEKRYHQPKLNMGELSKQIGSNRSYLSNYINSRYSCTFYEWIAHLRMDEAKELLLKDTNLTVVQIAEQVGFSSSSHFTHLFTEKEGISPSKWREEHSAR